MSPDKHKHSQQPGNREEAENHSNDGHASPFHQPVRVTCGWLPKVSEPAFAGWDHASSIAEAA